MSRRRPLTSKEISNVCQKVAPVTYYDKYAIHVKSLLRSSDTCELTLRCMLLDQAGSGSMKFLVILSYSSETIMLLLGMNQDNNDVTDNSANLLSIEQIIPITADIDISTKKESKESERRPSLKEEGDVEVAVTKLYKTKMVLQILLPFSVEILELLKKVKQAVHKAKSIIPHFHWLGYYIQKVEKNQLNLTKSDILPAAAPIGNDRTQIESNNNTDKVAVKLLRVNAITSMTTNENTDDVFNADEDLNMPRNDPKNRCKYSSNQKMRPKLGRSMTEPALPFNAAHNNTDTNSDISATINIHSNEILIDTSKKMSPLVKERANDNMVTYFPKDSISNASSFIQQLEEARMSIQCVFRDIMEKLQQREAELLKQLENIKSEYELDSQETLNALKSQRNFTLQNLKLNQLKEFQLQQLEQLNQMISRLEMEVGVERRISWSWDSQLIEDISSIGKLEVITEVRTQKPISVDYKQKVKPIISKCRDGSNDGDLNFPSGVAVDMNTGNMYITDRTPENHCVKVYGSNGDFLFKFGDSMKLLYPRNICIYKEKLYLSHNHGVVIFNVTGHLLHKFGAEGSENDQFKFPFSIAISTLNSDIYICDNNNHRIQIHDSKEFKYKSTIGKGSLNYPLDIKFSQNELYILDEQNPCLHVYTTEHVYVRSVISKGPAKQIDIPICFHIDNNCNILITEFTRHCLYIFTNRGELLHQIGGGESSDMYQPTGVTIDKDGRIIIANNNPTTKLLIY